jgi:hypothetical protein
MTPRLAWIAAILRRPARLLVATPKQLPKTAFQKGCAPGPGRPPGVRNKLTETVTAVLSEDFELHGKEVIAKVRDKYPQVYLSAIVSLLPKQQQIEKLSPFADLTDEELRLVDELLTATRAGIVRELEQHNGATLELKLEPSDANQQADKPDR